MKIRVQNHQNDWSDFGKGFIVKIRKNTWFSLALQHFIMRIYAQEFSNFPCAKFGGNGAPCNIAFAAPYDAQFA